MSSVVFSPAVFFRRSVLDKAGYLDVTMRYSIDYDLWLRIARVGTLHHRQRGLVTLTCGFPVKAAWRTNLLEENQSRLMTDGHQASLYVKPFEIGTVRITVG